MCLKEGCKILGPGVIGAIAGVMYTANKTPDLYSVLKSLYCTF
jgi:hypothetical protein